jgi:transcriptional regulator with XRE-family HTH domain
MQGYELKALRKAAKLTQGELAEAIGLSQGFIGEMERDEKPIEKRTELAVRYVIERRLAG